MFKIIENKKFVEQEGNITYSGLQLHFLGMPIASKYYLSSEEKLNDGKLRKKDYFKGQKDAVTFEGVIDNTYPTGVFSYYEYELRGDKWQSVLRKQEEYDDNGLLRIKTCYLPENRKKVSYYDAIGRLCGEEMYRKGELYFRESKQGNSNVYEIFSSQNNRKIHVLRITNKNDKYDCLSEIRELKNTEGKLISKISYKPSSVNGVFFVEKKEAGKTHYMLVKRAIHPEAYKNDIDLYEDVSISPCVQTKETLYKMFSKMLALKKEEDKLRQNAIVHIRKASTLADKKNVVLAFRAMEKLR